LHSSTVENVLAAKPCWQSLQGYARQEDGFFHTKSFKTMTNVEELKITFMAP